MLHVLFIIDSAIRMAINNATGKKKKKVIIDDTMVIQSIQFSYIKKMKQQQKAIKHCMQFEL